MFTIAECKNHLPEMLSDFCITENFRLKLNQREVLDFLHCSFALHVLDGI